MINYGKSNRLHARCWLVAAVLGCLALSTQAADVPIPKPANGAVSNPNYLEYQKTGNTYTWKPVGTTTPPGSGTVSFPSTSTVSDVTPKMNTTGDLPYQHKGGAGAKVTISTGINKAAVAKAAASAVNDFAAAAAVVASNPYVQLSLLACSVFCGSLMDWGIDKLKDNGDGTFSAVVPDPTVISEVSDGKQYSVASGPWSLSPASACQARASVMGWSGASVVQTSPNCSIRGYRCDIGQCSFLDTFGPISYSSRSGSSCPAGSTVVNGVCNGSAPEIKKPLDDVFKDNIVNKPWGPNAAAIAAVVISSSVYQSGKDIFTDGTSNDITGPDLVPIGKVVTSTSVNVLPGTTTPAPPGHTGPTDSGTQTTTSTTTATNTFNPGSSGSGSSGSGSGPSMTTGTKTETKTSITNNITNNTSTSVTTNIETKDDAPKEPEKDFCEKNPEALACAEADTPEQDIPRDKVTISYEYADIFGNGACPADSYLNTHGQSLKVWDWQASCDHIQDYFRPVLIACCAFAAFVIISAGVK